MCFVFLLIRVYVVIPLRGFRYRIQDIVDLLGEMVEDHSRVQPNLKTYA
jgi:hypothetical protein